MENIKNKPGSTQVDTIKFQTFYSLSVEKKFESLNKLFKKELFFSENGFPDSISSLFGKGLL